MHGQVDSVSARNLHFREFLSTLSMLCYVRKHDQKGRHHHFRYTLLRGGLRAHRIGFEVRGVTTVAWFPKNPAVVGQSFGAERLGFSLTSRLATPLDWPSHHTRPGPPVFFFHPESAGGSRFRIRQHGAKRKKEARQIRDRRVLIGRGLAT